jgi:hypothetical protein
MYLNRKLKNEFEKIVAGFHVQIVFASIFDLLATFARFASLTEAIPTFSTVLVIIN